LLIFQSDDILIKTIKRLLCVRPGESASGTISSAVSAISAVELYLQ